jgi:transcriptional regulator with XRE-family HTH domain
MEIDAAPAQGFMPDHKGNFPIDGKKVEALRLQRRLKPQELAKLADITPRSLFNIETGRCETVRESTFFGLVKALGVAPEEIMPSHLVQFSAERNHREVKTTFVDGSDKNRRLLKDSFAVYEKLFPDAAERDDTDDIEEWLHESRTEAENDTPWREFYAVLHVSTKVIGMAYVSGHTSHPWFFGNYFGVLADWRTHDIPRSFLSTLRTHIRSSLPGRNGIVFEIDPIDVPLLLDASHRPKLGHGEDHEKIVASLRAAQRLRLYESSYCLTALNPTGNPLHYQQPAMDKKLTENKELALMVHLFDSAVRERILAGQTPAAPLVQGLMDFNYDTLYRDAYGPMSPTGIIGFEGRLAQIKAGVYPSVEGCSLGYWYRVSDNKQLIKGLMERAKDEGWEDELHL